VAYPPPPQPPQLTRGEGAGGPPAAGKPCAAGWLRRRTDLGRRADRNGI